MNDLISRIERGEMVAAELVDGNLTKLVPDFNITAKLLHLAKLGQQRDWIPVTERLPYVGEWVLVAYGKIRTVGEARLAATGSWYQRSGYIIPEDKKAKVTHWMPLPAPPEQREGR